MGAENHFPTFPSKHFANQLYLGSNCLIRRYGSLTSLKQLLMVA